MNIRCSFCQTPYTLSRVAMLDALQEVDAGNLTHYDAHCPRCRRATQIPRQRLEMAMPNWREELKQFEKEMKEHPQQEAPLPTAEGTPVAEAEAQAAISSMNGADLDGRALKVNEAEERSGGRSGGGGGPGGQTVAGVVKAVRGVPNKVWAVSYPVDDAARLVFSDAAGHEVTQLNLPSGDINIPARPSSGGIGIYKYAGQWVTAYRISGGRIGFWWKSDSSLPLLPVSEARLSVVTAIQGPPYWYGYAPADVSRVTIRMPGGQQYSSSTRPGWPGSGISFWGPVGPVNRNPGAIDTIVITYDAAGHILQEVPLIFLG